MKSHFNALRKMYTAVINVLTEFAAVYAGYDPFENSKTNFLAKVDEIDATNEIQQKQIKGFTSSKKSFKLNMAKLAFDMSNIVQAWAKANSNIALLGEMNYTINKIYKANETQATTFAENIYNAADSLTDADKTKYKITATYLLQCRNAIDSYKQTSPRDQIVNRKTATEKLNTLFTESESMLENEIDNLISMYRETNPDFYNQYFNARISIESKRYTTFTGLITDKDTLLPLGNVKVTIEALNTKFEEMTDTNGNFKQNGINPELDYDFTFELPGYQTKKLTGQEISPGDHEKLFVELVKV